MFCFKDYLIVYLRARAIIEMVKKYCACAIATYTSNLLKMAEFVCGVFVEPKKNTKSSAWLCFSLLATQDGKVIEIEQERLVCKMCGRPEPIMLTTFPIMLISYSRVCSIIFAFTSYYSASLLPHA